MNKNLAKKIATDLTISDLRSMFETAKTKVKNWNEVSNINKSLSKGHVWNIFYPVLNGFSDDSSINSIVKRNMVIEFGEYLPDSIKNKYKTVRPVSVSHRVHHQEPKFN